MVATHTVVDSPVGKLTLVADEGQLIGVYFPHHWYAPDPASFGPRTEAGSRRSSSSWESTSRGSGSSSSWRLTLVGMSFSGRSGT
jgi:hypothetical protein